MHTFREVPKDLLLTLFNELYVCMHSYKMNHKESINLNFFYNDTHDFIASFVDFVFKNSHNNRN